MPKIATLLNVIASLMALTAVNTGLFAQAAPTPVAGAIEQLKAGDYLWAPQIAPDGPVVVVINLKLQRAYTYRNGVPIGVTSISSGKAGHLTPTGVFTILQKDIYHHSNKYSNAPMPYMQRLTWDGVAMHAGNLPGYAASHGCIRLPYAYAKLLFGITKLGLTVVITDDPIVPEVLPAPAPLEDFIGDGHAAPSDFNWHPERAKTGPLSIVVSGSDHKIVVLRNGVEIGSSNIEIDGRVTKTMAFSLRAIDASGIHWLRLPLPGGAPLLSSELTPEERARSHLPPAFRADLDAVLKPGTTLLITRDSLISGGTGKRVLVLTAAKRLRH